ncbi:adhesive plaque matrix protein-like [Palaemon carinicauda]|uniref:adhesive plaque matrix protein-like n=1 Tax=Palaemon carinicauda TaxID=392227 RepID=UPI0035B5E4AE
MLLNIATVVFMSVANVAFTEPANVYPSYDYASFNPYSTPYSRPDAQTPTYNPYGYPTYYPSAYPSQPSQSGQPAYTYASPYPSYPSYPTYPTYPSYPPYSHYPSYPYYHFYSTQPPPVDPETSPPAGPIVWPTGKPKTTPRPAVWPTGSPTRPPSIPVWPTKKASLEASSWPTAKTEPKRPTKYLQWPTEKSALPPTTTTTKRPEKLPNWPTGPPRTTGVASVTVRWPTGAPGTRITTTTPATITGRTTVTAAQPTRPAVWPTRSPNPMYSPRRISGVTTPMPRIPVSRTERPKVNRGKTHRGERPRKPNSRRKPKNKGRKQKTKPARIPTISPITTPIPYFPDEDVEIIEGIPKYVPFAKSTVPPLDWDHFEPRISPLDTSEPLTTPNYNETSLAPGGVTYIPSAIPSTTNTSTRCKKLCLDQKGRRFCCGQETGKCPPKPESCYVPMSDPIPGHRSKGQCFVDTQCAENFKCCLDYCEEEYYCTRVQFVL